eukprot:3211127-Pyramimonas_sp.AAC.1
MGVLSQFSSRLCLVRFLFSCVLGISLFSGLGLLAGACESAFGDSFILGVRDGLSFYLALS